MPILERKDKLKLYTKTVKNYLNKVGRKLGFQVKPEWNTGTGNVDLVWYKKLEIPLMNEKDSLPIVGFEIESSDRRRKHLKGDVFNLLSLSPSLGVIILIEKGFEGSEKKAEFDLKGNLVAIRKYISGFRGVSRLEVWTAKEVEQLFNRAFRTKNNFFK